MQGLIHVSLIAVILFFVVIGVVNIWVRYRIWHDDELLMGRIYTSRRMLWLYVKSWSILMAGLVLLYLFDWLMGFVPDTLYDLTMEFRVAFYILCGLLMLASFVSIVNGETLAELRLRSTQNENQMLRSQLNPHFLYNTLNNIDALIWLDQDRASAAVNQLSSLMRYFTYSGRQDEVEVGEEVSHLSQLVELQRLRMPNPESLVFETSIDDRHLPVAPLLLIPLVENCFKHCGDLNEPGAIVIHLTLKDGVLEYSSDNNLKAETEKQRGWHGLGTSVLRRRLELLYNNRFVLQAEKQESRYITYLKVIL